MEDAEKLVKMAKVLHFPLPKPEHGNNRRFLQITAQLHDKNGISMEGLRLYITWRDDGVPERCNTKITLQSFLNGRWQRIFQIEVYERQRISHTFPDGRYIRGPELQYNGRHRPIITNLGCAREDRRKWMARFTRHCNIACERKGETLVPGEFDL